ncbi:MAG: SBBP repeat-containing protein, partial [Bacteroidota bacterium]
NALDDDPSIAIDHQGNIILTAEFFATLTIGTSSLSPAGGRDILVAKYNSDGEPQWAQQLGFSDVGIEPSVAVDANDNIYLGGYFEGTTTIASTTLSSPSGDYASYIIRMDASGTAQWAQQLEGVDGDVQIYDIAVQGSSIYVAGAIEGTVATIGTDTYTIQGGLDGFFAQYDLNGNYVASSHLISSYYVEAYTIAVDQNGNIFVGGYAFENMDFDGTTFQILGGECLFIAKYDVNQDLEWVRYQDQNDDSEINALCIDDEANVIAIGKFEGMIDFDTIIVNTASRDEVFVLKYDTDGNFEWVEKGTSNDSSRDFAYGIGISPQNVIYALGSFVNEVSFSDISMTGSSGNSDPLIVRLNNEDGSQSFFDNSLAGSQDGDIDSSNELQDISLNGSLLSISNGSEVDLSTLSLSTVAFSTENGLTQSTNDSDDFLFGATELDNTSGTQQTKFFFDNAQGAFRVGSVLDDNGNQDSIGFASIGLGIDVLATGANTIALGSGTVASGNTSTAIGSSTAASGNFSTALGASTEASGNFSTALGFLTTASGQNSTALGSRTEALSFAEVATG